MMCTYVVPHVSSRPSSIINPTPDRAGTRKHPRCRHRCARREGAAPHHSRGGGAHVREPEAASVHAVVHEGGHQHHAGQERQQQRHPGVQRADHQLVREPQLPAEEHPRCLRGVRVGTATGLTRVPADQVQRLFSHGRRAVASRRQRGVRVRQFLRVSHARHLGRSRPLLIASQPASQPLIRSFLLVLRPSCNAWTFISLLWHRSPFLLASRRLPYSSIISFRFVVLCQTSTSSSEHQESSSCISFHS